VAIANAAAAVEVLLLQQDNQWASLVAL
jgi:hypothetical protein